MRALMLANKTFAAARELFENRTGKFIKTKKLLTFHCYLYVPCAARDTIFLCVRTMQFASSQSIVLVCTLYSVHMSMPFFGNTFNNTFNIYKYLYIDTVFSICYLAMEPKRFVFFSSFAPFLLFGSAEIFIDLYIEVYRSIASRS